MGYSPACLALLVVLPTAACSRDKSQALKYTDPARRFTADGYRDPHRIVLAADFDDPRLFRATMILEERGIKVFGGGNLGTMEVRVDVDDEMAAYEILRAIPEFEELIVTRKKYVPK